MKLILHDLTVNEMKELLPRYSDKNESVQLFSAVPKVKYCMACFGCWLKTPGMCVIDDKAQDFMKFLVKTDELHIISRMLYGGLSTEIKAVLDRSLGYILPYFDLLHESMHHPPRYTKKMSIHYHMYSDVNNTLSDDDREILETIFKNMHDEKYTMNEIAKANAKNLTIYEYTCSFYKNKNELGEKFK